MKYLLTVLLCGFLLHVQSQDAQLLTEVEELKEDGKYEKAIKLLTKAIEKEDVAAYYFERGMIYYVLAEGKSAFADFSKSIQLDDSQFDAFKWRGNLYLDLQMFTDSKADYEVAYENASNDSLKLDARMGMANYYLHTRNDAKAVEILSEYLEVYPEDLAALNNIAISLEELDRREEAIEYLKRIVDLDPEFYPAYVNLGFQLSHIERYDEAIEYFNKAQELAPKDPLIFNNRGYVYYKMGEYKKALKEINTSLKLYAGNSYAYRNRALVYAAQEENELACIDVNRSLQLGYTQTYGDDMLELKKEICIQ